MLGIRFVFLYNWSFMAKVQDLEKLARQGCKQVFKFPSKLHLIQGCLDNIYYE